METELKVALVTGLASGVLAAKDLACVAHTSRQGAAAAAGAGLAGLAPAFYVTLYSAPGEGSELNAATIREPCQGLEVAMRVLIKPDTFKLVEVQGTRFFETGYYDDIGEQVERYRCKSGKGHTDGHLHVGLPVGFEARHECFTSFIQTQLESAEYLTNYELCRVVLEYKPAGVPPDAATPLTNIAATQATGPSSCYKRMYSMSVENRKAYLEKHGGWDGLHNSHIAAVIAASERYAQIARCAVRVPARTW